ncbi:MAG TPA: hypothetical protein VJ672_09310 [Gemmatimonadaceae bacterium]|nr:hypothetical protein [Gemmatimonadaceae bacterium]
MNVRLVGALIFAVSCSLPASLTAQVGNPPGDSPYRDVPQRHSLTPFTGYMDGDVGRAGVGPEGGPAIGLQYDLRIAGPVWLTARVTGVATERLVLDPEEEDPADRVRGKIKLPVLVSNVGFTMAVTGQKSWHRLQPLITAGAGLYSDLGREVDDGGFNIGTPFALSVGAGVRYVPGGRLAIRLDLTDHLYKLRYPTAYFVAPSEDSEPVLPANSSRSEWTHNPTLTIGLSYLFGR